MRGKGEVIFFRSTFIDCTYTGASSRAIRVVREFPTFRTEVPCFNTIIGHTIWMINYCKAMAVLTARFFQRLNSPYDNSTLEKPARADSKHIGSTDLRTPARAHRSPRSILKAS